MIYRTLSFTSLIMFSFSCGGNLDLLDLESDLSSTIKEISEDRTQIDEKNPNKTTYTKDDS